MVVSKEKKHKIKQQRKSVTKVIVDTANRRKFLSKPTDKFSVNNLVVSNLIRSLEVQMVSSDAEKVMNDSDLLHSSVGKTLIFIGDISKFEFKNNKTAVELVHLTVVGEQVGNIKTAIKSSISNLVAESATFTLDGFDFDKLSGKLLLGTTVMFSAKVVEDLGLVFLENRKVLDFGLRLFQEDGSVDKLAIFNDLVDTYGYEYYTVNMGVVLENPYRNTSLDAYISKYGEVKMQKPLEEALQYILGTYDEEYKKMKATSWGIIRSDVNQ